MQAFAHVLLLEREERLRAEDFLERLKLSAVSASPPDYIHLITGEKPEHYVEEDEDELDEAMATTDEEMEWDFSQSQIGPEEAMRILSGVQSVTTMTSTLGSDDDDDDDDEWTMIDIDEDDVYGDDDG